MAQDQFIAEIQAKLNITQAESEWNSFRSKLESNALKVKIDVDNTAIKNLVKSSDFTDAGKKAGKSYQTALQRQIETVARTQRNAFSPSLDNMTKKEKDYSDWWNKQISKSTDSKYNSLLSRLDTVKNYNLKKFDGSSGVNRLTDSLKKATDAKSRLDTEMAKGTDANIDNINSDLKLMESELKKADSQWDKLNASANQIDNIKAGNATLAWLNNNTKAAKEYGEVLKKLAEQQKNAATAGEAEALRKQVQRIQSDANQRGLTGKSWIDESKRAFSAIAQFTGMYGVLQGAMQDLPREMVQNVISVDSAITELRKVSDANESQLSSYFDEAAISAKKYGAAIDDVIASTADWSRLGYEFSQAKELSDATTLLQTVGDNMTQKSSAQGIISTLRGFSMVPDDVTRIIDVANEIANTKPIDTAGIFEGLERSASSMSAANNTFEETVSLITAAKHCWLYVQKCA